MSIDEISTAWLTEPPWQKVFKHTFDVMEDYLSYVLITVGAITLSVKFLSTLSTGDVSCIILGVENGTLGGIDPYPSGGTLGLINYASTDPHCINAVLSSFMDYLPYIFLLQSLILVIIDKISFKIPRIGQRVERFYTNIVEESLFGKDPDAAEDLKDPKTSTEAISRGRLRNEICVSLKRSSIISQVYIAKNALKILIVIAFIIMNSIYLITINDYPPANCKIAISSVFNVVEEDNFVHFQCRGKKTIFFVTTIYIQTILLAIYGICAVGATIWSLFFRSVSNLLKKMDFTSDEALENSDFLFLFDLLSHSCGVESTLRVLSQSEDLFYAKCKPKVDNLSDLFLEEDKLKITWKPADIEKFLKSGKRNAPISIESYEVTIFPVESVQNTQTIPADLDLENEDASYSIWFYDLIGGRTEYVITIAAMIGKSRMKGEKVVTTLVPYGPEKPRTGMVKSVGTHQAEIFWDPPKGEFTKYTLMLEKLDISLTKSESAEEDLSKMDIFMKQISSQATTRKIENLSSKLTNYTIMGLEPAEAYHIELGTKTGHVETRQIISDIILTQPSVVNGILVSDVTDNSCVIRWILPEGQNRLRGFQIKLIRYTDNKTMRVVAVKKSETFFKLLGLSSGTDFQLFISAMCTYSMANKKAESEATEVSLTTLPEAPKEIKLDSSSSSTITIKWDPLSSSSAASYMSLKFRLTIDCEDINYHNTIDVTGDRSQYQFSKLPEIIGTGREYVISVASVIISGRSTHEVVSKKISDTFYTKPLSPTNLRISNQTEDGKWKLIFDKSLTETVKSYRIKWKGDSGEEGLKAEEMILNCPNVEEGEVESTVQFTLPIDTIPGVIYKINIYSLFLIDNFAVESKELHVKIMKDVESGVVSIYNEKE